MSLNNISNNVFPNTLSGLDSINLTNITINGQDITTLFVPYTNATANVNLGNKALTTNQLSVSTTLSTDASGNLSVGKYVYYDMSGNAQQGKSMFADLSGNLYLGNTAFSPDPSGNLFLSSFGRIDPSGNLVLSQLTGNGYLYSDASGNTTIRNTVKVAPKTDASTYYFPMINGDISGNYDVFSDGTGLLSYIPSTGVLTTNKLKISNVPSGTQTSLLAVDSGGNVIQGTVSTNAQTIVVAPKTNNQVYYPTFINDDVSGNYAMNTDGGGILNYNPSTGVLAMNQVSIKSQSRGSTGFYYPAMVKQNVSTYFSFADDIQSQLYESAGFAFDASNNRVIISQLRIPSLSSVNLAVDADGNVVSAGVGSISQALTNTSSLYYPLMSVVNTAGTLSTAFTDVSGNFYFNKLNNTLYAPNALFSIALQTGAFTSTSATSGTLFLNSTPAGTPIANGFLALNAGGQVITTAGAGVAIAPQTANTNYYIIGTSVTSGTLSVASIDNANRYYFNPSTGRLHAPSLSLTSDLIFQNSSGIYLNNDINWYIGGSQKCVFDNGGNSATFRISASGTASDLVLNASYNVATQIGGTYKLEVLSDKITSYVPIRTNVATGEGNGILFSLAGYSAYQYNGGNIFAGTSDAYNPTSTANPLMIGSWNGIGFHCNFDDTVRGGFDTRTGSMAMNGNLTLGGTITNRGIVARDDTGANWSPNTTTNQCVEFIFARGWPGRYADGIVFNTYVDGTGGNDNLLLLSKSGIAMRIYQQAFGSSSSFYSGSYADAVLQNSSGNVEITNRLEVLGVGSSFGGASSAGVLNIKNPSGLYTHFGWTDGINYIRGPTECSTTLKVDGSLTVASQLQVNSSNVRTIGVPNISVGDIANGGQYRAICISVGVIQRNDEGNYYFLVTNAGDPYGTWNGLRPLFFSLGSGMLYSNNGQIFQGGLDTPRITFQNGKGIQGETGSFGNVRNYGMGNNGWSGYSISNRYVFMANIDDGGVDCGVHDNSYSWLIRWVNGVTFYDRSSFVYNALPQQSYKPNQVLIAMNGQQIQYGQQYSTWYYAQVNWGGGLLLTEFNKSSAFSFIRVSGWVTKYSPNVDISSYIIRMVNSSTGGIYDYYQRSFINATYQHESFGCMVQADLPAGYYYIYLYQSGNTITDSNDFVSLLIEVTPH